MTDNNTTALLGDLTRSGAVRTVTLEQYRRYGFHDPINAGTILSSKPAMPERIFGAGKMRYAEIVGQQHCGGSARMITGDALSLSVTLNNTVLPGTEPKTIAATIYSHLKKAGVEVTAPTIDRENGHAKLEFRLPLANLSDVGFNVTQGIAMALHPTPTKAMVAPLAFVPAA
jgi:hypothetical protein